jgi:hypothetical protein
MGSIGIGVDFPREESYIRKMTPEASNPGESRETGSHRHKNEGRIE